MLANQNLRLFDAYPGNSDFFMGVCNYLNTKPSSTTNVKFNDGDTHLIAHDSLSGCNAFIFQSYIPPYGQRLYELELAINGVISRNPDSVTVIIPFHFGSRGERRTQPGEAINLNVVVSKFDQKVDKVVTVDAHTESIGTLYDYLKIGYINLLLNPLLADYCIKKFSGEKRYTTAALDIGGIKDNRNLIKLVDSENDVVKSSLAIVDKDRYAPGKSKRQHIIGELLKNVFAKEDMIDTGGTMIDACRMIKETGFVESISTFATHPIFSKTAVDDFLKALEVKTIDELIISDTIPIDKRLLEHEQIKVISSIPLVGEAIKRIHEKHSTSHLYKYDAVLDIYTNLKLVQQIPLL